MNKLGLRTCPLNLLIYRGLAVFCNWLYLATCPPWPTLADLSFLDSITLWKRRPRLGHILVMISSTQIQSLSTLSQPLWPKLCKCHCVFHPPDSLSQRYFYSHFRVKEIETFRSLTGLTRKNLSWDSNWDMLDSHIHQVFTLPCHDTKMPALFFVCSRAYVTLTGLSLRQKEPLSLLSPLPFPSVSLSTHHGKAHTRHFTAALVSPGKVRWPASGSNKTPLLTFPFFLTICSYLTYFCIPLTSYNHWLISDCWMEFSKAC